MAESVGPGLLDVLRVAGALLLVAGLAAGLGILARRGARPGAARRLRVEERLAIARGVQLVVVAEGERRLLVGVSDKGVSLVSELGPVAPARVEAVREAAPGLPGFAQRLAEAMRARVAPRGGRA